MTIEVEYLRKTRGTYTLTRERLCNIHTSVRKWARVPSSLVMPSSLACTPGNSSPAVLSRTSMLLTLFVLPVRYFLRTMRARDLSRLSTKASGLESFYVFTRRENVGAIRKFFPLRGCVSLHQCASLGVLSYVPITCSLYSRPLIIPSLVSEVY